MQQSRPGSDSHCKLPPLLATFPALRHDVMKVERDQQFRFTLLVEAFADADSSGVALVTDLIVFFNTVISSAFEFEERVLLRTEMINAGILEAMSRIRDYYGLSKVCVCVCARVSYSKYNFSSCGPSFAYDMVEIRFLRKVSRLKWEVVTRFFVPSEEAVVLFRLVSFMSFAHLMCIRCASG